MQTIATPHFLIRNGRVRPRFPGDPVSNELTDHIAAEIGPLGLVPDGTAFERLFVEVVLATHPDPARAWGAFYRNTMRRLRGSERGGTDCVATFARIYRHVLSLIRGSTEHLPAAATASAFAQLLRVARRRVVVAVPLEGSPDPTFGHVQAFDLHMLAAIAASVDASGWSRAVYSADGGWLVLDRCGRRPPVLPDRVGRRCPN